MKQGSVDQSQQVASKEMTTKRTVLIAKCHQYSLQRMGFLYDTIKHLKGSGITRLDLNNPSYALAKTISTKAS